MSNILVKETKSNKESRKNFINSLFVLFSIAIAVFFLGDIISKAAMLLSLDFTRYSTVSKVVVLILFFWFFIINFQIFLKERHFLKITIYILILVFTFIIGQISMKSNISQPLNILLNIEYLTKYLYLPIILLMFSSLQNEQEHIKKLIIFLELIFIINAVFILLGFLFDINVLSTYSGGVRFGYKGIFSRSGQTSFYFIIFILYYFHLLIEKQNKLIFFKFIFSITVSLLVGTKRIYFFLILLILYYFFVNKGFKRQITYKIFALTSALVICFWQNINSSFNKVFILFQNIYFEDGFMSSLTSYRSDLLLNTFNEFIKTKWTILNYIFGGASFQDYIFITGMDLLDLYLFFGLIGILVYWKIFIFILNFKMRGSFLTFFLLILAVTSFFSSAFLYDPYVNLLFVIMIWFYRNIQSNQNNQNHLL